MVKRMNDERDRIERWKLRVGESRWRKWKLEKEDGFDGKNDVTFRINSGSFTSIVHSIFILFLIHPSIHIKWRGRDRVNEEGWSILACKGRKKEGQTHLIITTDSPDTWERCRSIYIPSTFFSISFYWNFVSLSLPNILNLFSCLLYFHVSEYIFSDW